MNINDLSSILASSINLIVLETYDEPRALSLLQEFLTNNNTPAWTWSITDGFLPVGFGVLPKEGEHYYQAEQVLAHIKTKRLQGVFILKDLHPYLDEPKVVRLIKDIVMQGAQVDQKLILLSHELSLPTELGRYAASISMSLPTDDEILGLVRDEASAWSRKHNNRRIKTDNETLDKLVANLRGMPHMDVRKLIRGALADGVITETDLPDVSKAKFELMNMDGVLHFEYSTAKMADVAGFHNLKQWLSTRRDYFIGSVEAKDKPKGVLLFGVQGGGKSLAAKAIAGVWSVPLLRLDVGALYNKFIGETERNLRDALKMADTMAPCVLWFDEMEKGLAKSDSDAGVSQRLMATLLTWMAERKSRVFMVATSNNIHELPPELMRKGRFDETFFVDLPDEKMREEIFSIHLHGRELEPDRFDLKVLAKITDGYTGAEIEQSIIAATYSAAARKTAVTDFLIKQAIRKTRPLSVMMAEQVTQLRMWAQDRAVLAN